MINFAPAKRTNFTAIRGVAVRPFERFLGERKSDSRDAPIPKLARNYRSSRDPGSVGAVIRARCPNSLTGELKLDVGSDTDNHGESSCVLRFLMAAVFSRLLTNFRKVKRRGAMSAGTRCASNGRNADVTYDAYRFRFVNGHYHDDSLPARNCARMIESRGLLRSRYLEHSRWLATT